MRETDASLFGVRKVCMLVEERCRACCEVLRSFPCDDDLGIGINIGMRGAVLATDWPAAPDPGPRARSPRPSKATVCHSTQDHSPGEADQIDLRTYSTCQYGSRWVSTSITCDWSS